jgi:hypothetical protein
MKRLAPTLIVLALLAGTAAAFAVTEKLKLEPGLIRGTSVDKVLSPVCRCDHAVARIRFRLRQADTLELSIVDRGGKIVRTITARTFRKGWVAVSWNGRDDFGRILPDGRYRPRVHLAREYRTIVLPNPIALDSTPPRAVVTSVRPVVFSPDGDRRHDVVQVRYRLSEPAHPSLLVNGNVRVRGRSGALAGSLQWYGVVGGRALPAGSYRVTVAAVDLAGNRSRRSSPVIVRIRYVELARHVIRVQAQTRFGVHVSTDVRSFRWRLGKRSGVGRNGLLVVRAPDRGSYALVVEANGHRDRATVLVRPRSTGRVARLASR